MKKRLKIGDIVRIKTIEELAEEFYGYDCEGDVEVGNGNEYYFTQNMSYLSNRYFTINENVIHDLLNNSCLKKIGNHSITLDMVEIVESVIFEEEIENTECSELVLNSLEDTDMNFIVESNWGDSFFSDKVINLLNQDTSESVFCFVIEDTKLKEGMAIGMNMKQVKGLCNYLDDVLRNLELFCCLNH